MFKVVQEPYHIDIFHKIELGEGENGLPAGRILMKKDEDTVVVSDGSDAWGVLSQEVFADLGNRFPRQTNNFEAYDGGYVGIYHEGRIKTDQFEEGTYAPGADLFVSENGKFTDEGDVGAGAIKVGRVISKEEDLLFIQLG